MNKLKSKFVLLCRRIPFLEKYTYPEIKFYVGGEEIE